MEEIKDGEYVRTTVGTIAKIVDSEFDVKYKFSTGEPLFVHWKEDFGGAYTEYETITKHSFDIVDLIEVGDYVNGKEVIKDLKQSKEWYDSKDDFVTCKDYTFSNEEIKTILTKELYTANCYEVK